jgi:tetratricopeptide (TPR) repeat protein
MENEYFGRLLKAGINSIATCEGKTAPVIEEELGEKCSLSGYAIQRYKAGHIPPDHSTIEIIAEAAVTRGLMNQEWLRKFLHSGRYPNPEKISAKLFPQVIDKPRSDKIYQNLPTPTYSSFVMRDKPFADLMNGLRQRVAVVLVVSMGGMGKTSIAREVAQQCIFGDGDHPKFDAAVWISDKGREGTTTLNMLFDEICRTLEYPGLTSIAFEDKKIEVENMLRKQRVLILVDNFETITDSSLVKWLLNLPEPSKVIVTSREYSRIFRNCTFVVELHGMEDHEAKELVLSRSQMLGLDNLFSNFTHFEPLLEATGGNPKAIELSLGLIKYQHKPLNEIVNELYDARGELFEYLFARCWQLLSAEDEVVMFSMNLFAFGAYPNALSYVSGLKAFPFEHSLTHLTDLSLIDVHQADLQSKPYYTLHSLVKSYTGSKLRSLPDKENELRLRWMEWYKTLASNIGFCWNDVNKLKNLDPVGERENLEAVVEWCIEKNKQLDIIQITKDVRYYYYVRGIWETKNDLIRAEAASRTGDKLAEFEALVYHVNIASKQNNVSEVEKYLHRLDALASIEGMDKDSIIDYRHAKALYYLARREFGKALELWNANFLEGDMSDHSRNANRRWMAICLYHSGEIDKAKEIFEELYQDATSHNFDRGAISAETYLASIAIDRNLLEDARTRLKNAMDLADTVNDKRAVIELSQLYAKYYLAMKDKFAARESILKAIDGFERLGLQNKVQESREILSKIIE